MQISETQPIKPEHKTIADTFTGEACKLYTLDGVKDAIIAGRLCRFATVRAFNGMSIEVTWPLVERKMQGDKTFYAC